MPWARRGAYPVAWKESRNTPMFRIRELRCIPARASAFRLNVGTLIHLAGIGAPGDDASEMVCGHSMVKCLLISGYR